MHPELFISFFSIGLVLGLSAWMEIRFRSFERRVLDSLAQVPIPFALASRQPLFSTYRRIARAMTDLGQQADPLLHDLAALKLTSMAQEVENLARGTVVFSATETWRASYQQLLMTLKVQSYFSVAWVRSSDYWNDAPGRQSMQVNYEMVQRGFRIQRIHILPDQLWPFEESQPAPEIRPWLKEQHEHGIIVLLVREADLIDEPDLIKDFAIYGDRATAIQQLDERSKTQLFTLSFDGQNIRQALDQWERLSLFSTSWEKIVDQAGRLSV